MKRFISHFAHRGRNISYVAAACRSGPSSTLSAASTRRSFVSTSLRATSSSSQSSKTALFDEAFVQTNGADNFVVGSSNDRLIVFYDGKNTK
jgi:hypothetical protein